MKSAVHCSVIGSPVSALEKSKATDFPVPLKTAAITLEPIKPANALPYQRFKDLPAFQPNHFFHPASHHVSPLKIILPMLNPF